MPAQPDALLGHIEWMRLRNRTASSIKSRRDTLLRIERAIGKPLTEATEDDLDAWQRTLRIGPGGRAGYISHLRSFFGWCVKAGYLEVDPTSKLVAPTQPTRLPRPISEERLEEAIDNAPARIKPMLILAAYAGMRVIEIAGLRREDVLDTADPPVLVIANAKGMKQRVVPMGQTIIDALREYGMPAKGWVFTRRDGKPGPNSPAQVSHLLNMYLHSVGISDTAHSLRHRYATAIYAASEDLRVTQELLGHARIQTTAGYTQFSQRKAVAAVRALDEKRQSKERGASGSERA